MKCVVLCLGCGCIYNLADFEAEVRSNRTVVNLNNSLGSGARFSIAPQLARLAMKPVLYGDLTAYCSFDIWFLFRREIKKGLLFNRTIRINSIVRQFVPHCVYSRFERGVKERPGKQDCVRLDAQHAGGEILQATLGSVEQSKGWKVAVEFEIQRKISAAEERKGSAGPGGWNTRSVGYRKPNAARPVGAAAIVLMKQRGGGETGSAGNRGS
ncbi:hypothetical protein C8R45DRAFT_941368 [Mycena sanguinolenta]|nr:hypothetical protein C8R45DRAFT_941368 [Mycena sanguinolenta]